MPTLGQELIRLRGTRTQQDIADAVGHKKPTTVTKWEGDSRKISAKNLPRVAKAYGTTVTHLKQFGEFYSPRSARVTRKQRATHAKFIGTDSSSPLAGGNEGERSLKDLLYNIYARLSPDKQTEWVIRMSHDVRLEPIPLSSPPKHKAAGDA